MKKALLLFCLVFFLFTKIYAQTINLEEARMHALANSHTLARYNLAIRSSILNERNRLYTMLPTLSATYSASVSYLNEDRNFENPQDTFSAGAVFSITQIIFEGGKNFIQKAISAIETEIDRKGALAEYFNVLDAVDSAYYAALEAAANLKAEETALETAVLSLSIAEVRQEFGLINMGDYLRALADKEARENSRNQARRNLALCMTRLRLLTGLSETIELEEIDFLGYEDLIQHFAGISDEDANLLFNDFFKILIDENPSIARAVLSTQRTERNLSLTKRDFSPTIRATIFSTAFNYSRANGYSDTASGGVVISGNIPIDFWVMANRIERSRIAHDSAILDYIITRNSLETDLQSALLNAFSQAESVLSSRRSLDYTERHFEFVMERYRLGQSSISDLGEASLLLITSQNNLNKAIYGFLQSLSRLRTLGALSDEEQLITILMGA